MEIVRRINTQLTLFMDKLEKIKFYSALLGAKTVSKLLKLRSKNAGTSFPGLVALKIDKDFLSGTKEYCKKNVITVTGTNGKTTTSGLLAAILKQNNEYILHNQKGANMPQGIAAALALGINPFKAADYFVLENDEAYLSRIYDRIKADYLIVTNLFRDQLDRYGELESTARKIRDAIDKNPDLTLLLNADDPMLRSLYTSNTITFGFEDIEIVDVPTESHSPQENIYCNCSKALNYTKNFYAHIGHYSCECGYKRVNPQISATAKIYKNKSVLNVEYQNKNFVFEVSIPGLYNAYNALAAIAMALILKISPDTIQAAFNGYQSVFGRAERLNIQGKDVFIQLIKNPVGASEVLRTISADKSSNLLIVINDEYADGRDVSWLWDADFEAVCDWENKIITSGKRAEDMALRLKYAGLEQSRIEIINDIETALKTSLNRTQNGQTLNVLPTYTALLAMQDILKNLH